MITITNNLQNLIRQKGMTQKQIAEELGMTKGHVSKVVNSAWVSKQMLERFAKVLNVEDANDLIKIHRD